MHLAEPSWLVLLLLCTWPLMRERSRPRLAWPTLGGFGPRAAARLRFLPPLLRAAAIACLAVALARPQSIGGQTRVAGRGVAVVAAVDQSGSMNLPGFALGQETTRLDAAKRTFARFIEGRTDDPIGMIAFANYADIACPPTLDHRFLLEAVGRLRPARPGDDGTNLGAAIAKGLQSLARVQTRRKVLILLTDGRNRPAVADPLDPLTIARLAPELGVTIHTIAIGQVGGIVRPREGVTGLEMPVEEEGPDLKLLGEIAKEGRGRLFVAADAGELEEVFRALDALGTSPVTGTLRTRYREEYAPWVVAAVGLLLLDRALSIGRLRRLP